MGTSFKHASALVIFYWKTLKKKRLGAMIAYLIDQRSQLFLKTFSIIVSST